MKRDVVNVNKNTRTKSILYNTPLKIQAPFLIQREKVLVISLRLIRFIWFVCDISHKQKSTRKE